MPGMEVLCRLQQEAYCPYSSRDNIARKLG